MYTIIIVHLFLNSWLGLHNNDSKISDAIVL